MLSSQFDDDDDDDLGLRRKTFYKKLLGKYLFMNDIVYVL